MFPIRILGDGYFIEEVLRKSEETLERKTHLKAQGINFDKVVERVAGLLEISAAEALAGGKKKTNCCGAKFIMFLGVP